MYPVSVISIVRQMNHKTGIIVRQMNHKTGIQCVYPVSVISIVRQMNHKTGIKCVSCFSYINCTTDES